MYEKEYSFTIMTLQNLDILFFLLGLKIYDWAFAILIFKSLQS